MPLRIFFPRAFLLAGLFFFLSLRISSAEILLNNGQLTVQVNEIPLTALLDEISKQGHISIITKGTISGQRLTIKFGPLPLESGLKRILRNTNYITIYDQNGNLVELSIFGATPALSSGANSLPQVESRAPVLTEPSEVVSASESGELDNKAAELDADRKTDKKEPESTITPAEVAPKEEH